MENRSDIVHSSLDTKVILLSLSLLIHFVVLQGHTGHKTMRFAPSSELAVLDTRSRILPIGVVLGKTGYNLGGVVEGKPELDKNGITSST
jgi:hypothetical protein